MAASFSHIMKKINTTSRIKDYIIDFSAEFGCFPSFDDIREAFDIKSVSTVYYHLKALEKEGLIERKKGKGKAYTLKNAGVYFKIPLEYVVEDGRLIKIEAKEFYPASRDDIGSIAIKVCDKSLEQYNIESGTLLFVKQEGEMQPVYIYTDSEYNLLLSEKKLQAKSYKFIGVLHSKLKTVNKEAM